MREFGQPTMHSRSGSDSSGSSKGSAYQLILDHILSSTGNYEIPLRTMYTLNCAPRTASSPSSTGTSPLHQQAAWLDDKATHNFQENLMAQLSQLPTQPTSLPPTFILSFVKRCFPSDLLLVDFPQALTGLDYLKDLETRRRREVAAAMARLDIDSSMLGSEADLVSSRYLGLAQWVNAIEDKERKIEALYTQLYVGLRRWILINELSLLPFNKHNSVAMLNTLYPPVISTPPTSKLTASILKNQRNGFFKYIQSVERNGPRVLATLMQQGQAPGDETGWPAVVRTLSTYLQTANTIITRCSEISKLEDILPRRNRDAVRASPHKALAARRDKVDSGVSFDRPAAAAAVPSSSSPTNHPPPSSYSPTTPNAPISPTSPLPPLETSNPLTTTTSISPPLPRTGGTAFGKLARGFRGIGRNRTAATEMVEPSQQPPMPEHLPPPPPPLPTDEPSAAQQKAQKKAQEKNLRKMRSMNDVRTPRTAHIYMQRPQRPQPKQPLHDNSSVASFKTFRTTRNNSDASAVTVATVGALSTSSMSNKGPVVTTTEDMFDWEEMRKLRAKFEQQHFQQPQYSEVRMEGASF